MIPQFFHITPANRCNFCGTFYTRSQWIDVISPIQHSSFPKVPVGNVPAFIPTHPSLVLAIMDSKYRGYAIQYTKIATILHHKRYQACVMIVAMHYIGLMFPTAHPAYHGYLKSGKTLRIIIIPIYFLSVQ